MHVKKSWIIGLSLLAVVVLIMGGLASFIVFNAQAAADFTDNYLRPLLGENAVIAMERVFYNTSDTMQRLRAHTSAAAAVATPDFSTEQAASSQKLTDGHLDLMSILPNTALPPLGGEGVWQEVPVAAVPGKAVLAETFLRPDKDRPYAVVTVAQLDMQELKLSIVAGKKDPGGSLGNPGPGVVPPDVVQSGKLVAAFDGGFLYADGQYGLEIAGKTYAPLKPDAAALVSHSDGRLEIVNYTGQTLGTDVNFVRENCPILIDNGMIIGPKSKMYGWGKTTTSDIYTWRSGIGLTKDGNLLFAAGNNLNPMTLAMALQAAGAVQAMQLDINPAWVKFNLFTATGPGTYSSVPLTKELHDGAKRFLGGNNKDFFYVVAKN